MPKISTQLRKVFISMEQPKIINPSFGFSMLRCAPTYTPTRLLNMYDAPAMRMYFADIPTSSALSLKSDMKCCGIKNVISAKIVLTAPVKQKAMPITRFIESLSCLPQNWLISTAEPLCTPNTKS